MKNLEVDSPTICLKEANFHIVIGKSDHFEFCDTSFKTLSVCRSFFNGCFLTSGRDFLLNISFCK